VARGWKRPLQLAGICWVLFVVLLVAAYWLPAARWADGWAVAGFLNLQQPWLTSVASFVAHLCGPGPFVVWTALVAGVALRRHRPRHALAVVVLLGVANVITQVLKHALAMERWHAWLGNAQIAPAAFPSGHATASMSLALAAILVAPAALRPLVAVGGAVFTLAVSESVMFLAWHFPSDVAGGFLVATASTLMTVAALRAADQRWPERSGREAARRAIGAIDARRAATTVALFVIAALAGLAVAAGGSTLTFAGRHTTAVVAAVAVAALGAALPVSVAALGARRP
jgi:membrane-associated phospholipid phosphatase